MSSPLRADSAGRSQVHPRPYVVSLDDVSWRVVIPVSGKLTAYTHEARFGSKGDAEQWLNSSNGRACVAQVQKHRAGRAAAARLAASDSVKARPR